MTYASDIEFFISNCTKVEGDVRQLLSEISNSEGMERHGLLDAAERKLEEIRRGLEQLDLEVMDVENDDDRERFQDEAAKHRDIYDQLRVQQRDYVRKAAIAAQAIAEGVTPQDLMRKAADIQKKDIGSLQRTAQALDQAKNVGEDALTEIDRQQNAVGQTVDDLDTMDSELARARKILGVMVTRAAGDNCVRVLALLVIIAVVVVIVVEAVSPGTVKETSEGWFDEGGNS